MTIITETGPFERLVKLHLSDDQIAAGKTATARRLSRDLKLKGFRPGKAPLPVVEAAVGSERLRREVIDDLVPEKLRDALRDQEIRPAVTPELESLEDVDDGVDVEVKVTLWPTVELPVYKDRTIEVTSPEVSEEELEANIERMLEQFATVEEVDRPAGAGDFVSIDVEAFRDGGPLPGTRAADLLYEVGSGLLIRGMDDHLEGASAGARFEFEAPLPEGFGEAAGETVLFKVLVHEVKERVLPPLDDEWVSDNTEFETVDELRLELAEALREAKLRAVSRQFAERALQTLVDQVEVDIPEGLVRAEMDDLLHRFLHRLEDSDLTLDDYFRASGIEQSEFIEELRNQAVESLRNRLVLEAVATAEGIEITEEDLSRVAQSLASRAKDPVRFLREFRGSSQELSLAGDILRNRALGAIVSSARAVDSDGNPVDVRPGAIEVEAEVVEAEPVTGQVYTAEVVEEEE